MTHIDMCRSLGLEIRRAMIDAESARALNLKDDATRLRNHAHKLSRRMNQLVRISHA